MPNVGSAWYELGADDSKLRGALQRSESSLRQAGVALERGFGGAAQKGFDQTGASVDRMSGFMGRATSAALGFVAAQVSMVAATKGFDLVIGNAIDFERAMLNVNSIVKDTDLVMGQFADEVIELSKELPQSADTLAKGLYDIASSGFAGADATMVLDAAARAASAGLAQTEDSARGLTAVLNAYGLKAGASTLISDIMFKVVDRGVVTFGELAGEIGKTTALSAPLRVTFEEVGAALAVMTRHGIDAENATTQLNAIMATLLKPSQEAAELAAELGIGWDAATLRAKGLNRVLVDMIAAVGGDQEKMATLLGDVRAIRGAFVLAGDGGAEFTEEIGVMAGAAGATAAALSIQQQGLGYQLDILGNKITAAGISLGTALIPALIEVAEVVSVLADSLGPVIEFLLPGLIALMGVGLVRALARAALQAKATGLAFRSVWAAVLVGIPLLAEAAEGVHDFVDEVQLGKDGAEDLALIVDDLGNGFLGLEPAWIKVAAAGRRMGLDFKQTTALIARQMRETGQTAEEVIENLTRNVTDIPDTWERVGTGWISGLAQGVEAGAPVLADAVSVVPEALKAAAEEAEAVVRAIPGGWAVTIKGGATLVGGSAEELAGRIPQAVQDAKDKADLIASLVPGSIAAAIIGSKDELDAILPSLTESIVGAVSDSAAILRASEILAGVGGQAGNDWLAAFLIGSSDLDWEAIMKIDELALSVSTINADAFRTGAGIPTNLRDGVFSTLDAAVAELDAIRERVAPTLSLAEFARAQGLAGMEAWLAGMGTPDIKTTLSDFKRQSLEGLEFTNNEPATGGEAIGDAWIDGIVGGIREGRGEVVAAVWGIRALLGHSLPTEGPLAGSAAYEGGYAIGESWVSAIAAAVSNATINAEIAGVLGGASVPVPVAPASSVPVVENHYYYTVNVDGMVQARDSAEVVSALVRMSGVTVA